jgi:long-subunit fatty acid transport protein
MRRTRFAFLVPMLGIALYPLSASAQTNGYLLPCSAASSLGRGCTLLGGTTLDAAGMLTNPASLVFLEGRSLSLSGAAFAPTMDYANAANPRVSGDDNVFPLPAVFFADRQRGRLAFGAGIQTLGGMGADYRLTHPVLGADQRYHSKFGLMKGALAGAVRLNDRFALGVSVGLLYGQLEFATPYSMNPAVMAGMAALAQDPDYAPLFAGFTEATAYAGMAGLSGFELSGSVSAQYQAGRWSVAAFYTPRSVLTLSGGTADMDMTAQFGQLYQGMVAAKGGDAAAVNAQLAGAGIDMAGGMTTRFGAEVDFGVPATAGLALGFRPSPRLSLALDGGWIGYAKGFEYMDLRMRDGTNANINIMINANPADGDFDAGWELEWQDTWVARAGAEWQASRSLSLRGGLMYGTNPVPGNTLFTIFPAIVQTAATAGVAYRAGPATVSASYARAFRRGQTAATPHLVAREYEGSTSRLAEDVLSLGLVWRF